MQESDRQAVRPVLDLLTGIKVGEPQPVATAEIQGQVKHQAPATGAWPILKSSWF